MLTVGKDLKAKDIKTVFKHYFKENSKGVSSLFLACSSEPN